MPISLSSISTPQILGTITPERAAAGGAGGAFKQVLASAIEQVEGSRAAADAQIRAFLSGENTELHTTILAEQTAELQFEMFLQARNKVVSAYEEIMKMQL
jgi:flagellar hook-basal body complex protein FliE